MELTRKTTILLPPDLHDNLTEIARRRGTSLGQLVREACAARYGLVSAEDRARAVEELSELRLPVAAVSTMKRQSVAKPEDLLP
jgi:predicted DNA-binding protein